MIYKQLSEFQHCVPIPSCQSINQSIIQRISGAINQSRTAVVSIFIFNDGQPPRADCAHRFRYFSLRTEIFWTEPFIKRERADELERTDPISRAVHRLNTAVVWVGGEGANSLQPRERTSLGFLPWLRRTSTAAQNAGPPGCSSLLLSIALRRSAHNCWCICCGQMRCLPDWLLLRSTPPRPGQNFAAISSAGSCGNFLRLRKSFECLDIPTVDVKAD